MVINLVVSPGIISICCKTVTDFRGWDKEVWWLGWKTVPYRFMYLNIWFPVGSGSWKGFKSISLAKGNTPMEDRGAYTPAGKEGVYTPAVRKKLTPLQNRKELTPLQDKRSLHPCRTGRSLHLCRTRKSFEVWEPYSFFLFFLFVSKTVITQPPGSWRNVFPDCSHALLTTMHSAFLEL